MSRPSHRSPGVLAVLVLTVVVLATSVLVGCSGPDRADDAPATRTPTPTSAPAETETAPTPTPTPTPTAPTVGEVSDARWAAMVRTGAWRPGCPVDRDDLRELEVTYVDFEGVDRRGVLVANRDVVGSLGRIFITLHERGFPIERMDPVEAFDGDTLKSLQANNTSAYNCRRPDQINAPVLQSPHANGRAIDINPDLNPWMDLRCRCWSPRATHAERTPAPGKILADDATVRLFEDEGWIWQNIDVADYMHFDTGYPSKAWTSPRD
ncbi:M15 family metallopeptidase [Aeromicrobium sp. Leaf291]|uniref:M15 family metallopeptidase n=1 Tax=Aeromicrobium sp. Leaf291 TaxID=1736325 RepID=UPI000ABF08FC|nr:M15 family metallopeptidase [Aeromicrobium sp. Leaf291]